MNKKNINEYIKIAVGALLGVFFTAIYDYIKSQPILTTFTSLTNWFWHDLLQFKISLWIILLSIILIYLFSKIKKKEDIEEIPFLKYNKDKINGTQWKWEWEWDIIEQRYFIKNLAPLCNYCGTSSKILDSFNFGNTAECPRCGEVMRDFKSSDKIKAIIIDNIERDNFLHKINL